MCQILAAQFQKAGSTNIPGCTATLSDNIGLDASISFGQSEVGHVFYCMIYVRFPAGHVDGNETIIQAAIRETQEEAGVKINKDDLSIVHVLHKRDDNGSESIDFFIESTKWEGTPKVMEPEKCEKLEWFELNNLPENIVGSLKHVIEKKEKNIFYSDYGWE